MDKGFDLESHEPHFFRLRCRSGLSLRHHVTGTRRDNDEEQWTTGIGVYADNPMSENAFRAAFGLRLREMYY